MRPWLLLFGFALLGAIPFEPLDLYGVAGPEYFRQRRVREILIQEQGYENGRPQGRVLPVSLQRLDAQGRVSAEFSAPEQGRFTFRREYAYDATNSWTDIKSFGRLADPADTSLLGRAWLPHQHTHFAPVPAGKGFIDTWNQHTGDWQRDETSRRWTSHDTSYVLTSRGKPAEDYRLTRTYKSPNGISRYDVVALQGKRPWNFQYHYFRQENGRQVESGMLYFDQELARLAGRDMPGSGTALYNRALDNLARHSNGERRVQATRHYDAQGRLVESTYGTLLTRFVRNEKGLVVSSERLAAASATPGERTTFTYQPGGLLAQQETNDSQGVLISKLVYRYKYY